METFSSDEIKFHLDQIYCLSKAILYIYKSKCPITTSPTFSSVWCWPKLYQIFMLFMPWFLSPMFLEQFESVELLDVMSMLGTEIYHQEAKAILLLDRPAVLLR